jgi:Protein of unknown function (DUF2510)
MSVVATTPIPAGWYPDPHGNPQQRWWDGDAWTSDVAPYEASPTRNPLDDFAPRSISATQFTQNLPSYNAVSVYGAVQAYSPESALSQGHPEVDSSQTTSMSTSTTSDIFLTPLSSPVPTHNYSGANLFGTSGADAAAIAYEPFGGVSRARTGAFVSPTQRFTASVWVLAGSPLIFAIVGVLLTQSLSGAYTRFSQLALVALATAVIVGLAGKDRYDLRMAGHRESASLWWLLLTPIGYQIVRAVHVRKQTGVGAISPVMISILVIFSLGAAAVLQPSLLASLIATAAV